MSGYIGNDGSNLAGGLNPSGVVTAFKTNTNGDLQIGNDFTEMAGLTASANGAFLLPKTDVSAYKFFSVHITGVFTAGYQFQGSNDGINFIPFTCYRLDNMNGNNANVQSSGSNQMWGGALPYRFLQIQVNTYTSGTINAVVELFTAPPCMPVIEQLALQDGAWNIGLTAGSNVIGAFNNDGVSTTAVAAATVANTVIKATAGRLARILVTATGTANVLIYDNASTNSGTVIGVIKSSAVVGDVIELRIPAANGITVAGSANNGGFTVSWV